MQAYIIKVLCKDGTHYHIYRRYKQFDEMHNWLEKRFPIEAGAIKVKDRVLPNLPGRSETHKVQDKFHLAQKTSGKGVKFPLLEMLHCLREISALPAY